MSSLFAQMTTEFDKGIHKKIYRIEVANYQTVELIEMQNGEYRGTLNHRVNKTNRKGIAKDSIIQKINIPNQMTKSIITELKNVGIENLKNCDEVENCIIGLDGTTILFETITNGIENKGYYWELTSDYYYKQNKVDLPSEVLKARKLLAIINEQFDLNEQFQNFLNRLPVGKYSYGMQIMTKKRG